MFVKFSPQKIAEKTGGFPQQFQSDPKQPAWRCRLRALRLEEPLDFSEGDHGLSGGIQVPWHQGIYATNLREGPRMKNHKFSWIFRDPQ